MAENRHVNVNMNTHINTHANANTGTGIKIARSKPEINTINTTYKHKHEKKVARNDQHVCDRLNNTLRLQMQTD